MMMKGFRVSSLDQSQRRTFRSINQRSVVEQIIDTFKDLLMHGDLKAGQRLPSEQQLAAELGVGRSALREAMKVMQALGVVDIRQGDGTYIVSGASPSMLNPLVFAILLESDAGDDLFELRRLIEIGYCELASHNARPDDWKRIEAAAAALENYADEPNPDHARLTELDLEFHYAVIEATHNPLVIRIGRSVEELFFGSVQDTYMYQWDNTNWAIQSHRRIMSAIRDGRADEIRSAINDSLVYWKEELKKKKDKKTDDV